MKTPFVGIALALSGLTLTLGCTYTAAPAPAATTGADSATAAPAPAAPTANDDPMGPGTTCYSFENETLTLNAFLEHDGNGGVKGGLDGVIEDDEEGYYTSYATDFVGTLEGNTLKVKTSTEIEGSVQEEEETWKWDGLTLDNGRQVMKKSACDIHPGGE